MADVEDTVSGSQGDDTVPADDGSGKKVLTLTQEELNRITAENRRKLTRENERLASSLEELQKQTRLSQEEKEQLNETIETLRKQTMTVEEVKKQEIKKKEKEFQTTLERLEKEREEWKRRFTSSEINRSLIDAASEHGAYDAEQILGILGSRTRLVNKVDEAGKATDDYSVVVDYRTKGDDGQDVVLQLSPSDTVKAMKETERFANLFVAKGSPGLGQRGSDGKADTKPPEDTAQYMEWRKTHAL